MLEITQVLMTRNSALPKKTKSTRSEESPMAGAVYQHGQWLEQAVSLDLLTWLNPVQGARGHRSSTKVHRQILAACRRLKAAPPSTSASKRTLHRDRLAFRRELILAINRASECIPRRALSALKSAQQADVRYASEGPFGPNGEWMTTDFAFGDIVFGNPGWALEAMVMLRKHPVQAQGQAMQLLAAMQAEQRSAHGLFNESVPQRVRERWVRQSGSQLFKSAALTDEALQPLAEAVWHGMQHHFALPVALPGDASEGVLLQASEAYRGLRWCLQEILVQRPVGDDRECRRAHLAWTAYRDCAMACQVISSWFSALGAAGHGSRCEFCYRHRVSRRRCREHTVPESVTPEARLGRMLAKPFVLRVQALTAIPEIRIALSADRAPHALDLGAMLPQARLVQMPASLQHQAAVLAAQLRTLWPVLGNRLAHEVEMLFAAMVDSVSACHREMRSYTGKEGEQLEEQRRRSAELLTLRGFLMLWWGGGVPFRPLTLEGREHDAAFPHLGSGIIDSTVAHAFLRQRAWLEVRDEFVASTTVNLDQVHALQTEGRSLRQMAVLLGCSHEKLRKLLSEVVSKRRRRAVLSPYRSVDLGAGLAS